MRFRYETAGSQSGAEISEAGDEALQMPEGDRDGPATVLSSGA